MGNNAEQPMKAEITLANDNDYLKTKALLNAGKKPRTVLRHMMQALEDYRQTKKYGWSRAWNKYDVVNFQSFKLTQSDTELRQLAADLLANECLGLPIIAQGFVEGLLGGKQLPMGFVFVHEFNDNGQLYEGATLSFGRVNATNRRYRDRLDIILESPVVDGSSQGLARLRVYVDPYLEGNKHRSLNLKSRTLIACSGHWQACLGIGRANQTGYGRTG
jgi:hypothetical protein